MVSNRSIPNLKFYYGLKVIHKYVHLPLHTGRNSPTVSSGRTCNSSSSPRMLQGKTIWHIIQNSNFLLQYPYLPLFLSGVSWGRVMFPASTQYTLDILKGPQYPSLHPRVRSHPPMVDSQIHLIQRLP